MSLYAVGGGFAFFEDGEYGETDSTYGAITSHYPKITGEMIVDQPA